MIEASNLTKRYPGGLEAAARMSASVSTAGADGP